MFDRRRILSRYWRPPIQRIEDLAEFLSGEASYLAQRSTYEFSRNTLAWFGQWAFGDERFNDAFRVCRWEAFAAILAEMTLLAHARLSPDAGATPAWVALFVRMLEAYPTPAHRPQGWTDAADRLRERLAGDPPSADAAARHAARTVFATLPVKSANEADDQRTIESAIRFGMISFHDRLLGRLRVAELRAQFQMS